MDIEKVIRDYLPQVGHMSLGTCVDNKPWVCEVHFAYDDQLNLYFRSLTSRRHSQEIAVNPNVAGNVIKQHALNEYPLGVYFEGTAKRLAPGPEQGKAAMLIKEQQKRDDDILADAQSEDGHQLYKVTVANWYVFGKLEDGQGGKKYQLRWSGDHS